jgi:energy-coupling factor transporter ATP-binding protein EcfA2
MKLKAFRVTNYRCVQDSGWIDADDIIVLVGKNESGKTSLLKALHKFKPFAPEPYVMDREWPRGHRSQRSLDAVVVQTRFDFVEAEKEELAKIGSGAEKVTGVQISKMYRGDFHYEFLPTALPHEHDSKQFQSLIDHELSQIPDGISESLRSTFTTVSERAKQMVDRDGVSAFHQKLGELAQIIDQSVRVENPADTQLSTAKCPSSGARPRVGPDV